MQAPDQFKGVLLMISRHFLFCLTVSTLGLMQASMVQAQTVEGQTDDTAAQPEAIVITGSRIARRQTEGAAPVTILTGDAIDKSGFRSVFDALTALPQNTGYVQGEDFGSTFTPAANFVNLRGLGPNHSLVLVNGRRLADYPVAYDGAVNAVNLANIPNAFVDSLEVLSGSAGAVYGSDAIAGVVNLKLKEKMDGLDVNLRVGNTKQGGGKNIRGQFIGGTSIGRLDVVVGGEISSRDPIFWGDRRIASSYSRYSTPDLPQIPPSMFSISNPSTRTYYDPPAGACDALGGLQGHQGQRRQRRGRGGAGSAGTHAHDDGWRCAVADDAVGVGATLAASRALAAALAAFRSRWITRATPSTVSIPYPSDGLSSVSTAIR